MCLSDLTSPTPKKAKSLQMRPQNAFSGHLKPFVCSIFCDSCAIFGHIGPIVGNALGPLMKAFPWIGPKSEKGPKML